MTIKTIALVIGVSSYLHKEIGPIPAAVADSLHFARALKCWGVEETAIALFLNEEASSQNIQNFLVNLSKKSNYKFLFYFCGHGFRTSGLQPRSFLLLHDSQVKDQQCVHALDLDETLRSFGDLSCEECYVFIDACHLRINQILNPKLKEEIQGKRISKKSLFCLLAAGVQAAFEDKRENYGYFTEALLKSFPLGNCSPTQLVDAIHQELLAHNLPLPEDYNIGTQWIAFGPLESFADFVYRKAFIKRLQHTIIHARQKIVCLIGEEGVGKTTLCKWLASEKLKTIYLNALENALDGIENLDLHFLVIDNVDKLSAKKINLLIQKITRYQLRVVFTATHSLQSSIDPRFKKNLIDLEIPLFTLCEAENFIERIKPGTCAKAKEMIHLVTQGNPWKIKKILLSFSDTPYADTFEIGLKRAIQAICHCGFYMNEQLFEKVHHIEEGVLAFLKKNHLVMASTTGYKPHPLLFELAEPVSLNKQSIIDYWCLQFEELPHSPDCAKQLLCSFQSFGFVKKGDTLLCKAFHLLFQAGKQHLLELQKAGEMFNSVDPLSEATVTLAEIMTEWGEWEYAEKLLRNKSIPPALDKRVKFCLIQQGWASGSFNKSFALSAQMGESTQALFFRGVSLFFECQWYEASRDFTAIYTHFPKSRLGARAQCMASTIHAICGGDMQKVHETIEQACKLLNDYDDVSGLWSAWNNLGEIYLKKGNYSLARIYLKKALAFSCKLQVERTTFETIRNLIELGLREGNYFTNETTQLIEKLESTPLTTYLQKMQTFNTLALCFLRSRNIKKAASYLKSVIQTPGEKKGYYMYTLSHLSLLAKRVGRDEQGNVLLQRAVDRARHEGHLLALEQIKQDHYG